MGFIREVFALKAVVLSAIFADSADSVLKIGINLW